MTSKQFDSILESVPYATLNADTHQYNKEKFVQQELEKNAKVEELIKIVARVPMHLKEEIRSYIKQNKGYTESALILKGLKQLGFQVDPSLITDRRSLR